MQTYSSKSNARRAAKKVASNIDNVEFTKNEDGRWSFVEVKPEPAEVAKGLHKNSKAQQVRDIIASNKEASVAEMVSQVLAQGILTSKTLAKRYVDNNLDKA